MLTYFALMKARFLRAHHSFLSAVALTAGNSWRYRYHRDLAQQWDNEVWTLLLFLGTYDHD